MSLKELKDVMSVIIRLKFWTLENLNKLIILFWLNISVLINLKTYTWLLLPIQLIVLWVRNIL